VVEALPQHVRRVGGAAQDQVPGVQEIRRTRTTTVLLVRGVTTSAWVDQTAVPWSKMTRLPPPEIANSGEAAPATGLPPLLPCWPPTPWSTWEPG
jgi:hypothetical protein